MDDAVINRGRTFVNVLQVALARREWGCDALRSTKLHRAVENVAWGEFHALKGNGKFVCSRRDNLLARAALRCADGCEEAVTLGWRRGTGLALILLSAREEVGDEARHLDRFPRVGMRRGESSGLMEETMCC